MRRTEQSTYVVQVAEEINAPTAADDLGTREAWFDVATVTVPARTKRKAVIRAGLEKAGLTPTGDDTLKVRALNADSAHVMAVGVEQGPPQLRIG